MRPCIPAPYGGSAPDRPRQARRKGGLKPLLAAEAYGIPPGITSADSHRHDFPLRPPPCTPPRPGSAELLPDHGACHLDAGYGSGAGWTCP